MTQLSLEIQGNDGSVKAAGSGEGLVRLAYAHAYDSGDSIVLRSDSENPVYLVIQLEDSINPAFVYLKGTEYRFQIPFEEKRVSYSPKSFTGSLHALTAREATDAEIDSYKNVAKNEFDQHANETCFPHASANVETRGESVFAARNAINGNFLNDSHGPWPYESWGINQNPDAAITVDFGRTVEIDRVVVTMRADFPHDAYWEQVTLTFSDGTRHVAPLTKTDKPQTIEIDSRKVDGVTLHELIKADDPSPFPALTQLEVFGKEVRQ